MSSRAQLAEPLAAPAPAIGGLSVELASAASPKRGLTSQGELVLCFVPNGVAACFVGGRFVDVPASSVVAYWGALPHRVAVGRTGSELVYVRVPLATMLRWNLNPSFVRKILAGEAVLDQQGVSSDAELTRRWLADVHSGDMAALRTCELEVEARVRRMAWKKQHKATPRSTESKAHKQVEAITAFLTEGYRRDISTSDIGHAVGLHPNYAMTLFRRECGMSIWQYLIRLRLAHAQLMLLTTDKTVLAIALDSGFGSLARFYAAFTRECGTAPGEFRKRGT